MANLDQKRAAFAWKRIEDARKEMEKSSSGKYSDYKNLTKGIPAMIINNGLMQTLAFLHSKGKDHHQLVLDNICQWLAQQCDMSKSYEDLMQQLFKAKSQKFRLATEETMLMLRWLRQFADTGAEE